MANIPKPKNPNGRIGVLGGSGLYKMSGVTDVQEIKITTPFGDPSDSYFLGKIGEHEVVFLPRHGRGHRYTPTEVNYRANVFGLKLLHCKWVIGVSAVGSLQEEIGMGNLILIDQFIDKTKYRKDSFFGDGIVAHAPFSEPCCNTLRDYLLKACEKVQSERELIVHKTGTYVNMEGPAFSTVAESNLHRSWNGSVIGMTAVAEAKLCREAEISYAVLAMATDYDCWKADGHVTVDVVIKTLKENVIKGQEVVKACVPIIASHEGPHPQEGNGTDGGAMAGAIMTSPSIMPRDRAEALWPLISKYFKLEDIQGPNAAPQAPAVSTEVGAFLAGVGLTLCAVAYHLRK